MASSRWKRFQFFDRKNLPLPPSSIKDLIPPSLTSHGRPTHNHDTDDNALASELYEESAEECARIGIGGYFSLTCCSGYIPGDLVKDGVVERGVAGEGVAAMVSGWMARNGDGSSHNYGGDNCSQQQDISLQLVFISSRNTSLIHCIDVTGRCTPNNPQLTRKSDRDAFHFDRDSERRENEYNAEELDGWRGYYNPFQDGVVKNTPAAASSTGGSSRNAPPKPSKRTATEQRILDDHLSTSTTESLFASSPFNQEPENTRIIAIASCHDDKLYVASITDAPNTSGVIVHTNPHLRLKTTLPPPQVAVASPPVHSGYYRPTEYNFTNGKPRCVTIKPGVVCVGTDVGVVLVYVFDCKSTSSSGGKMALVAEIPAPRGGEAFCVCSVELVAPDDKHDNNNSSNNNNSEKQTPHRLFVSYRRRNTNQSAEMTSPIGGVCCYDLGGLRIPNSSTASNNNAPVISARYDMDGRDVPTCCLCSVSHPNNFNWSGEDKSVPRYAVARGDGLHYYSTTEKIGVCPVDGNKIGMCLLPPPPVCYLKRRAPGIASHDNNENETAGDRKETGATYVLVTTTDSKNSRDAVDIYDTANKLVGFHVLLSPGHRALRVGGIMSVPTVRDGVLVRGGRTTGVIFTSGGSVVTLTEKVTMEKVDKLVEKNLYPAAISMAFSDPAFYKPEDITGLYRKYAEHLYRKGDFAAAMDQYMLTIGSLESSHVIFRYLDAPKIPLVVKYLEALRTQGLSSSVHDEMLRTCYLKLNDQESASKIILSPSATDGGMLAPPLNPDGSEIPTVSISRNLLACADDPSEMLAAICSLDAPEAVEAIIAHGPMLARSLARETAGVVIALCDGTYSPVAQGDAAAGRNVESNGTVCEKYPISLFANAFLENPKLFRLILSHCRRNDCVLSPMLRRTLLELTLDEWNNAKRTGDEELIRLRHDEAITMLSESHADDMGDYEALVIVQSAGFLDGEILLYERLNMTHMLLEQYARSGNERARRQMLAMCEHDHELFPEVLAHFVAMGAEKLNKDTSKDEASVSSDTEIGRLKHDIQEALVLARDFGNSIPPVRVLRILAGEGFGRFSSADNHSNRGSVPLSVAMDYVAATLDESNRNITRLQNNVEEINRMCCDMEMEIDALLLTGVSKREGESSQRSLLPNVDIDEMYSNLCELADEGKEQNSGTNESKEDFWREMENSDDPFKTVCFFLSKYELK